MEKNLIGAKENSYRLKGRQLMGSGMPLKFEGEKEESRKIALIQKEVLRDILKALDSRKETLHWEWERSKRHKKLNRKIRRKYGERVRERLDGDSMCHKGTGKKR